MLRVGMPRVGMPRVGMPRVGMPRVRMPRVGMPCFVWECNGTGKGYHAERGSQMSVGAFLSSVAFLFLTVLPRRLLKPALKCAVKITAVTEAQP